VSDNTEKLATDFVLLTLKKRLFSSPAAFAATLEKHEQSIRTAKRRKSTTEKPSRAILQRQIEKLEEEYADDSLADEAAEDAVDTATRLFREPTAEELALLKQMKAWAATAVARTDSKVQELIRWLETNIRPNKKWTNNRVIFFTEYRATQNWLQNRFGNRRVFWR
jgi:ERCC4-related helicase